MQDFTQKLSRESTELHKTRREFSELKASEAKYLEEREERAQALLASITAKIKSEQELLAAVETRTKGAEKKLHLLLDAFLDRVDEITKRAQSTLDTAQGIRVQAEKMTDALGEASERVATLAQEVSNKEKEVGKREKEVTRKASVAESKLAEAEHLAYWHKQGKRYMSSNKK